MNHFASHFAPKIRRLPQSVGFEAPPAISVQAMAGLPALIRQIFGDKVLRQAKQAAMLDIELIEQHDCFIPQATMTTFLDEIERRTGQFHFGLAFAPKVSLAGYGLWGEYVLAADTLGAAIARATATLGYHSRGDRMEISLVGGLARLSYFNATRGQPGYEHVATGTAGAMLSLFRSHLLPDWRPRLLALDIPRPRASALFEETFSCPVAFDAEAVSLHFEARLLDQSRIRRPQARLITLEDVARGRLAPANLDTFLGVVVAQIWAQVLTGEVTIDSTARALDTSVRTLQRELHRDGVEFRELVNAIRVQRAKELLRGTQSSITEISIELGYSAPASFTRAFRQMTGMAPQDFRRNPAAIQVFGQAD